MPDILLTCSILGPDVSRVFPVVISSAKNIGQLKNAIKEKKRKLDHIDADELDIWKVSKPAQPSAPSATFRTYFQPPTPFSEVTIGDQLKGVMDGGNIPGAQKLQATVLVSSHFSGPSAPGTVDLVVQLPPLDKNEALVHDQGTQQQIRASFFLAIQIQ